MKTAWTLALTILGITGLAGDAEAQSQSQATTPAVPYQRQFVDPQMPAAVPQTPPANVAGATMPAPSPDAAPLGPTDLPLIDPNMGSGELAPAPMLFDNGLWDGASAGPCCAICGGGSGCPPDWYTEQGVRILGRSRPREIALGSQSFVYQGTTYYDSVFTNRSASPDISAAYAMTVGHYFARDRLNRDHFVELSFWGLNGWKDSAMVTARTYEDLTDQPHTGDHIRVGNIFTPYYTENGTFMQGFDGADVQCSRYESYNQNFEINGRISPRSREDRLVLHPNGKWRRECQPGQYMSYLYGIRYMQVDETFNFWSHSTVQPLDSSGNPNGALESYTGTYDVVTRNHLFGLQFGADMTFRQCRWEWGFRSKVGPYLNFSDATGEIVSPYLTRQGDNRLSAAKHEASLIGEVGITAAYKFQPNVIGRVGYDLMWVTGLALAPEQLQFVSSPVDRINNNGTIFYQGVSLSLEWLW